MPLQNFDDSVLCHVSTQHGARSADGATYQVGVGSNVLYGKTISRLTPVQIYCPNIFPNVKTKYTTFSLEDDQGGGDVQLVIPAGQYSVTTLITAVNTQLGADVTLAVNSQGFITATNNHAVFVYTLHVTNDNLGHVVGQTVDLVIQPLTTETMPQPPNLGGERMVHLKSEKLGHSNMLSSKSGNPEDVVFSVPLHNVEYGGMGCWQPGDHILGDQDFKWDLHIDQFSITLLDADLEPLPLPINYNVEMVFKVYHAD